VKVGEGGGECSSGVTPPLPQPSLDERKIFPHQGCGNQ